MTSPRDVLYDNGDTHSTRMQCNNNNVFMNKILLGTTWYHYRGCGKPVESLAGSDRRQDPRKESSAAVLTWRVRDWFVRSIVIILVVQSTRASFKLHRLYYYKYYAIVTDAETTVFQLYFRLPVVLIYVWLTGGHAGLRLGFVKVQSRLLFESASNRKKNLKRIFIFNAKILRTVRIINKSHVFKIHWSINHSNKVY